ncbi:hypothetical protein [Nitratireductor aquibiodomus]|uniref:hypothetical protein n=1 Tax=Nitratireductor aquibiodomus TaxID=204799 RepID=UPI00138E0911|nr:hypothetical protein [Nitratireductor aquibiodomus]
MNAAISRSLPTGPQSLDTGLQKRAAGEAGSPAFEEALQENQKAKGDPERKAGDEETGWHPIRWTLPHRMGGQEGPRATKSSRPTALKFRFRKTIPPIRCAPPRLKPASGQHPWLQILKRLRTTANRR